MKSAAWLGGMIYLEPASLGNECLVKQWLRTLPETFEFQPALATTIRQLWNDFVERGVFPTPATVSQKVLKD